jgi:hypothetical protein
MENQHQKTKGYRVLSQVEIDLMNEIKEEGVRLQFLVDRIQGMEGTDKRWASIGRTDFQTGLMALVRSLTNPDFF